MVPTVKTVRQNNSNSRHGWKISKNWSQDNYIYLSTDIPDIPFIRHLEIWKTRGTSIAPTWPSARYWVILYPIGLLLEKFKHFIVIDHTSFLVPTDKFLKAHTNYQLSSLISISHKQLKRSQCNLQAKNQSMPCLDETDRRDAEECVLFRFFDKAR